MPLLSNPTLGKGIFNMYLLKSVPIRANSSRCSGRQSELAPASTSNAGWDVRASRKQPIAGRLIPFAFPSVSSDDATTDPVLPAETKAEALPLLRRLIPITIDELGLFWSDLIGCSLKSMTCLASPIEIPLLTGDFSRSLR